MKYRLNALRNQDQKNIYTLSLTYCTKIIVPYSKTSKIKYHIIPFLPQLPAFSLIYYCLKKALFYNEAYLHIGSFINWQFRQAGNTESPQNASIKDFAKYIFESIAREAIQNSLDNKDQKLSSSQPIQIQFIFKEIDKDQIPHYEDLIKHYKATREYWKKDYPDFFESIDKRLVEFQSKIPCLEISDYNTTGMGVTLEEPNEEGKRKTTYFAFTRGNNSVKQNQSAGGSEGQGKATFYAASALQNIFVHTISRHGNIYEGLTFLATHKLDNQEYAANGYLFQDITDPIYETESEIQERSGFPFRRSGKKYGSTINVVGLRSYKDASTKMIKAVLNNFWMAILDRELIVTIKDAEINTEINAENLYDLIKNYLPERGESSHTKSDPTKHGRVRCYYETWVEEYPKVTQTYKSNLPTLGHCIFKIAEHIDFPGKVACFRKQKMLIQRISGYIRQGYCGVFICLDDEGNRILRSMEEKTHREWSPNNSPDTMKDKAKKASEEYKKFIKESWQSYQEEHIPATTSLAGLNSLSGGLVKSTPQKRKTESENHQEKNETPETREKREFQKLGVFKEKLDSKKNKSGEWLYTLTLRANQEKKLTISISPATDSQKRGKEDAIRIKTIYSDNWSKSGNAITGTLEEGYNVIEFALNSIERLALFFKLDAHAD